MRRLSGCELLNHQATRQLSFSFHPLPLSLHILQQRPSSIALRIQNPISLIS